MQADIGLIGLAVLPYKRIAIKKQIDIKTEEALKKLRITLDAYFQNEINKNLSRIDSIVGPHQKILRDQRDHYDGIIKDIDGERKELVDIGKVIDHVG